MKKIKLTFAVLGLALVASFAVSSQVDHQSKSAEREGRVTPTVITYSEI